LYFIIQIYFSITGKHKRKYTKRHSKITYKINVKTLFSHEADQKTIFVKCLVLNMLHQQ